MIDTTSLANSLEARICRRSDAGLELGLTMDRAFIGISALVFVASAAATIVWCTSMAATRGMPMPGGWTMSMTWMRMPGQTWVAVRNLHTAWLCRPCQVPPGDTVCTLGFNV